MTNSQLTKSGDDDMCANNGCHKNPRRDTDLSSTRIKCLAKNFKASQNGTEKSNEDADDVHNDSDTSTSFSLQECMNEFRARRIRRISLHRKEIDKNDINEQGATELDLIKQNLCNKEQERKCKPCQNGFCYCFTSDSGDGGDHLGGCNSLRGLPAARNSRPSKRSENIKFLNSENKTKNRSQAKDKIKECSPRERKSSLGEETAYKKSTTKTTSRLEATSNLETSTGDAPLIHIIQELRDNCIFSTVKINKNKIQPFEKKVAYISQRKSSSKEQEKARNPNLMHCKLIDNGSSKYTPTAPILEDNEDIEAAENVNIKTSPLKSNKKVCNCHDRRCHGQLLRKRLSISPLNYKIRDINRAPTKPPKTSLAYNNGSSASTSSSVREAERVVDNFLANEGVSIDVTCNKNYNDLPKSTKTPNHSKNTTKVVNATSKLYPQIPNKCRKNNSTLPFLSDLESFIDSKKLPREDKNTRPVLNNVKELTDCKETKISDMINCNVNTKKSAFRSNSTQAQPQQMVSSADVVGNEKVIGWQVPPKINLDTVDGIMHHNLASNLKDKSTPVKSDLTAPSQHAKHESRKQRFLWSEQLKNLSPWSNKNHVNETKECKKTISKKLLCLVSPKKVNRERNIQMCNVGVQTSCNDIFRSQANINSQYQGGSSPQSPPGSYHSPMQSVHTQYISSTQSQNTTANGTEPQFDFSRTVQSPPKKATRSSQRKLNFPLNYSFARGKNDTQEDRENCKPTQVAYEKETYRSFNSELDQDTSIAKINYILSNIRARLEANDEKAVRTFLETAPGADYNSTSSDCSDTHHEKYIVKRMQLDKSSHLSKTRQNEPIYSEIEDDIVYMSESPDFDNHTGIQHFSAAENPDILYAKVNKYPAVKSKLQSRELNKQISLPKIIQESLKSKIVPLPTLSEPTESESVTCSLPFSPSPTLPLPHHQSLNNLRVMECSSSPVKQAYRSKSELSLYRSDLFLENLCQNELITEVGFEQKNLEKVQNNHKNLPNPICCDSKSQPSLNTVNCMSPEYEQDFTYIDNVSYESPNDEAFVVTNKLVNVNKSINTGSNRDLDTPSPPPTNNQSTPKKRSFVTKDDKSVKNELPVADMARDITDYVYNSCPNTPRKKSDLCTVDQQNSMHSLSLNEVSMKKSNVKNINALQRYKNLKNVLQKSFRKSKMFIRNEGKRLSTSLNLSASNETVSPSIAPDKQSCADGNLNIDELLSLNDSTTVSEQIAQTVRICRTLPDLEISMERVEAERLLLFSALRGENKPTLSATPIRNDTMCQKRFYIDDMFLPILSNVNQNIYFNYFYIITFEYGGVVKSTQSAECVDDTVVFEDNGIEFICTELKADTLEQAKQNAIKCNIFMLRLRKISNATIEPKKNTIIKHITPSSTINSTSSTSSNEVISRFRLHATFTLDAKDFVPYEYVHQESSTSERICIRASSFCTLPLKSQTKSTNLTGYLHLKGRSEMRLPKQLFDGFLNVQDPYKQHNWNRRWCTLDGIFLYVWQDEGSVNTLPLIAIDLRDTRENLTCSPRELCARPRSFCLKCKINKSRENVSTATAFFSADTQGILDDWLRNLNIALDFILTWL